MVAPCNTPAASSLLTPIKLFGTPPCSVTTLSDTVVTEHKLMLCAASFQPSGHVLIAQGATPDPLLAVTRAQKLVSQFTDDLPPETTSSRRENYTGQSHWDFP